jgi:hypothetical protein
MPASIVGSAHELQRNIIGEHVLELPRNDARSRPVPERAKELAVFLS